MDNMNQQPIAPRHSSAHMWILIIVVLAILGCLGYYLARSMGTGSNYTTDTLDYNQTDTKTTASPSAAITSDTDLQSSQTEIESIDIDTLDAGLTQNDEDAATF